MMVASQMQVPNPSHRHHPIHDSEIARNHVSSKNVSNLNKLCDTLIIKVVYCLPLAPHGPFLMQHLDPFYLFWQMASLVHRNHS